MSQGGMARRARGLIARGLTPPKGKLQMKMCQPDHAINMGSQSLLFNSRNVSPRVYHHCPRPGDFNAQIWAFNSHREQSYSKLAASFLEAEDRISCSVAGPSSATGHKRRLAGAVYDRLSPGSGYKSLDAPVRRWYRRSPLLGCSYRVAALPEKANDGPTRGT